jgi:hypothetical protein
VYRLLKAHDLITSPAFIVMKAADEFKDKTIVNRALSGTPHRGGDRGVAQIQGLPAEDGRASALWVCSKGG